MRSLQYCCLFIPVKNRELLQMLLKFMFRLLDNHVISLSDDLPTKEMVSGFIVSIVTKAPWNPCMKVTAEILGRPFLCENFGRK